MLRIWYGTDGQTNADQLLDEICSRAEQGEQGQILLVPEQFSFDAEWRLSLRGGDTISRYAEVLSFTRLYDRVCAACGGGAVRIMDRSGRMIAMAGALEQVRSRLKIYGAHAAKPEFLLGLLALYEEFKSYGVSREGLSEAQHALSGQLAEKLEELGLLLESYESVCQNAALDPSTRLSLLADKLHESGYAAGRRVYVDGFTDFTAQELDVLAALLSSGAELTVSLCCDNLQSGQEVFSVARETARQLRSLSPQTAFEIIEPEPKAPAFSHLRKHLFSGLATPFTEDAPLTLTFADSPEQEALCAVRGIQELALSGVRWRGIAVACTDTAVMQPILERLFTRCRIPAYFAGTRPLTGEPVVRMLLSALRAACGRMEPEDVLDYCKSGFSPISAAQADLLENYALTWKLQGSLWTGPFTKDPEGFAKSRQPETFAEALTEINEARELAVAPLVRLRQALSAAENTGKQVLALADFLEEIRLRERLDVHTQDLQAAGELRRAQQTAQVYDALCSLLEQLYGVLAPSVRTLEEFYQFFRAALSQQTVGTIPATLDCVRVGSLRDLRNNRAPHLFVLGASDGLLPAWSRKAGLLSATERRRLKAAGLRVAPDEDEQLSRELAVTYTVLSSASAGLHLTCRREEPSYLFTRLKALFPQARTLQASPLPANAAQAAALLTGKGRLPEDAGIRQAAEALQTRAKYEPGSLRPQTAKALYGETLYLSASSADRAASCKLSHFLCYGLRAQERKVAEIDPQTYGSFVHDVLQVLGEQVMKEGGFHTVSKEHLEELTGQAIDRVVSTQLSALSELPERERYLFRRRFSEVLTVAVELWEELRQSDFVPTCFELPFAGRSAVPIRGKVGSAALIGRVDRVDCFDAPSGKRYFRVVDYKTGRKDFDYTDLLNGIDLQMLLYLFAIEQNDRRLLGCEAEGAGVLYMPAHADVLASPTRLSPEEAEKSRHEAFRRQGLVLDDETVRRAMEPNEKPVYLPCKGSGEKRTNSPDRSQLAALRQYVFTALSELVDGIYRGEIAPNPYQRGDFTVCRYCDYAAVCHSASGCVPMRELAKTDEPVFWAEIERRNASDG